MKLLAFDTASSACALALINEANITCVDRVEPMQQSKLILPLLQEILKSANLSLSDLDTVAFGCGPGSFTGMRIAASVVQGLSLAVKLPIIKISTLAAMAQAAFLERQWQKVIVIVDARMGQVYWGAYALNAAGIMELVGEECVCTPDQVVAPSGTNWLGVGDGWDVYKDVLAKQLNFYPAAIQGDQMPTGMALAVLAKAKFIADEFITIDEALPAYLR